MTAEPCPPAPTERRAASTTTAGAIGSTRTSIVPPQARPDVPRLLVADPVADDPGVAGRAGPFDLLGRGALDAAAAHRARDPAVGRVQQDGALRSRRGPERADDDGPAESAGSCRPRASRPGCRAAPSSQRPRCGSDRWSHHRRWTGGGEHGRGPSRRAARRGPRPRCPVACRPPGRRRGSRRAARGWRPCRPAGSRRCTGTPRASRRPAAGSRACRRAG